MRILLVSLCALACDGESTIDAGDRVDAGRFDAGRSDAGRFDAGRFDAGDSEGCALPVAFDHSATYETTLHVSPAGTAGGDGTMASPLTLEAAARRATPGTRILLAAGTYTETSYVENLIGEPARPIAIVADGDVTIDAGGQGEALHFSAIQYVVIEGITIRNATGNGINIDNGTSITAFVVLRDLVVSGVGTGGNSDCVKLSGIDDFWVLGGDLSGCNAGDAIDMVGCHDGVIRGVHIHDTPGGGIQAKGGSSGTIIHGNRFTDVAGRSVNAGGSTGDPYFRPIDAPYEAQSLYIFANVLERSGADFGAPIAYVGCDGCVFANNTIIEPLRWVARILQERTEARFVPCRNGVFANNIVVFDVADIAAFVNVGGGTAPETFMFDHNLWFARDDPSFAGPDIPAPIPPETGSIIQMDPAFATATDYHLQTSSPAIGAGRTLTGVPPYPDFDGRCYADPPAIGAFTP